MLTVEPMTSTIELEQTRVDQGDSPRSIIISLLESHGIEPIGACLPVFFNDVPVLFGACPMELPIDRAGLLQRIEDSPQETFQLCISGLAKGKCIATLFPITSLVRLWI